MMLQKVRSSPKTVMAAFSLSIFTDLFCFGAVLPILPNILAAVGEVTTLRETALYIFYAIGVLLSTSIFGILSDRYLNRKAPMLFGLLGLLGCILLFGFAGNFYLFLTARLLQGISSAGTWVVGFAMLADTFANDEGLGTAVGVAMSSQAAGCLCGTVLSGIVKYYWTVQTPFYCCLVLVGLDFCGRLFVCPPAPRPSKLTATRIAVEWHPSVLFVCTAVALCGATIASVETFVSGFLQERLGLDERWVSAGILFLTLPNILTSLLFGKACDSGSVSRPTMIAFGLVAHALVSPFVAIAPNLPAFIASACLFGATHSVIATPALPELASIVDSLGVSSYARVYAVFNNAFSIGMIFGPIVVGQVKAATSFFWGIMSVAVPMLAYAFLFLHSITRAKISKEDTLSSAASASDLSATLQPLDQASTADLLHRSCKERTSSPA